MPKTTSNKNAEKLRLYLAAQAAAEKKKKKP